MVNASVATESLWVPCGNSVVRFRYGISVIEARRPRTSSIFPLRRLRDCVAVERLVCPSQLLCTSIYVLGNWGHSFGMWSADTSVSLSGNTNGEVCEARCVRMELGELNAKGRRKPRPISDSEFSVPIEVVLVAYGFDPVPIFAAGNSDKIEVNKWSGVIVDENQMTSVPGVFAGGDLVRGPDLVVRAVRDSRKAAAGIHKYLSSQTQV